LVRDLNHHPPPHFKYSIISSIVFVTGNAGKLREVREILAQGKPIEIESRDLDCEY